MNSRPRTLRQTRLWLIQAGLIACIVLTGMLVRRQSLLLPETAATNWTIEPEHVTDDLGPTPTPGQSVAAPDAASGGVIAPARFFYADNFNTTQI